MRRVIGKTMNTMDIRLAVSSTLYDVGMIGEGIHPLQGWSA